MKLLEPIFSNADLLYCSCVVPNIEAHKGASFEFTEEQKTNYGQSQTHPSIVYKEEGWNGHKYWLATTPYPKATGVFENPCIYYGDELEDGTPPRVFTPISGVSNGEYSVVSNPVVKLSNSTTTNSDPDLWLDENNIMWLISRENTNGHAAYSQKSENGQSWTPRGDRSTMFLWKDNTGTLIGRPEMLSPAIIKYNDKIRVYALSGSAGIYAYNETENKGMCWGLWLLEGTTLEGKGDFTLVGKACLTGKRGIEPWHMDIFQDNKTGYLYMICSARNLDTGGSNAVYLAESKDGINFFMYAKPLISQLPQYRPTAFIREKDRMFVMYWCSEGSASTNPSDYPNGESDIPKDGRAIGLSYINFDILLSKLKEDIVLGFL